MTNFLEVMMKLKNARNLDVRQSGLVDSAYFAVGGVGWSGVEWSGVGWSGVSGL